MQLCIQLNRAKDTTELRCNLYTDPSEEFIHRQSSSCISSIKKILFAHPFHSCPILISHYLHLFYVNFYIHAHPYNLYSCIFIFFRNCQIICIGYSSRAVTNQLLVTLSQCPPYASLIVRLVYKKIMSCMKYNFRPKSIIIRIRKRILCSAFFSKISSIIYPRYYSYSRNDNDYINDNILIR